MSVKRPHDARAAGGGDLGQIDANDEPIGPCPSCGALLRVGEVAHPKTGHKARVLLHPMPFCTYYGETDPAVIEREVIARRLS